MEIISILKSIKFSVWAIENPVLLCCFHVSALMVLENHRMDQVRRDLSGSSDPNPCPRRIIPEHRIIFGQLLNISEGDSGQSVPLLITAHRRSCSSCSGGPSCASVYVHCLIYYLVPPGRAWLHPPDTLTHIYLCIYVFTYIYAYIHWNNVLYGATKTHSSHCTWKNSHKPWGLHLHPKTKPEPLLMGVLAESLWQPEQCLRHFTPEVLLHPGSSSCPELGRWQTCWVQHGPAPLWFELLLTVD